MDDRLPVTGEMADAIAPAAPTAIDESDAAYRRISGGMAAFYTPAPSCGNTEVEALKEQVAALQSQLDAERQQPDPLELAEEQVQARTEVSRRRNGRRRRGRADEAAKGFASVRHAARSGG